MPNFDVQIDGYNRVDNALRRLVANLPRVSKDVVYKWAQGTRAILKSTSYPPKRFKQRYVRTGQLANRWRAARTPHGATIINQAAQRGRNYATYVVGDATGKGQAWMHKGRWWRARDVIDEELPELRRQLAEAVRKEWVK